MNSIEKILDYQAKIKLLIEDLEGQEIQYNGCYAVIMFINLNDTATMYLEDEDGRSWEKTVSLTDLAKAI